MYDKNLERLRRARQTRAKIAELKATRLTVHRSNGHIYAQVIDASGAKVIASASTLDKDIRAAGLKYGGNLKAAAEVGKRIAERAKKAGVESVAFDRSGYKFHGRVKALATAAREAGLKF
jgi:large subunit ribosomal protein L18